MSECIEYSENEAEDNALEDDALDDNIKDKSEWPAHLDVDIKEAGLRFRKLKGFVEKNIAAGSNYRMLKNAQSIQDIIDADEEYEQFLMDTEACLNESGGLESGVPSEAFHRCHDPIEEEFAFKYGQRPYVKDYSFHLANDYEAFLKDLGIIGTANAYMKIDFEADLREVGHSNE